MGQKAALEKQELGIRLLSLINNVPGMVYRGHPDWSLSFIGAEVEPVTGYSAEEFTSGAVNWPGLVHPDDREWLKETFREAVKNRLKILRVEYRIRHKNGDIRWVSDRRQMMYNETGSFDYVDGLLLDITERKETDRKLAESENRFRTIADMAVNGMLTADSRGNIDCFNRAEEGRDRIPDRTLHRHLGSTGGPIVFRHRPRHHRPEAGRGRLAGIREEVPRDFRCRQ